MFFTIGLSTLPLPLSTVVDFYDNIALVTNFSDSASGATSKLATSFLGSSTTSMRGSMVTLLLEWLWPDSDRHSSDFV